jgi:protein gp37
MNKSKIEWTEYTSNPIKGKCLHACEYCYQRFGFQEQITFNEKELLIIENRGKASTIFMGSMHDIFGDWIPNAWINRILQTAKDCPQHTFLFLSKNPVRVSDFEFPENCWVGVTDDCKESDTYPLNSFQEWITDTRQFVSFDPLIGPLGTFIPTGVEQVIIGAMTGAKVVKPERKWVEEIIEAAEGKKIFLKDNLLSLFPDLPRRKELAWPIGI